MAIIQTKVHPMLKIALAWAICFIYMQNMNNYELILFINYELRKQKQKKYVIRHENIIFVVPNVYAFTLVGSYNNRIAIHKLHS